MLSCQSSKEKIKGSIIIVKADYILEEKDESCTIGKVPKHPKRAHLDCESCKLRKVPKMPEGEDVSKLGSFCFRQWGTQVFPQ